MQGHEGRAHGGDETVKAMSGCLSFRDAQLQPLELWEADRRTVVVTHDVDEAILVMSSPLRPRRSASHHRAWLSNPATGTPAQTSTCGEDQKGGSPSWAGTVAQAWVAFACAAHPPRPTDPHQGTGKIISAKTSPKPTPVASAWTWTTSLITCPWTSSTLA